MGWGGVGWGGGVGGWGGEVGVGGLCGGGGGGGGGRKVVGCAQFKPPKKGLGGWGGRGGGLCDWGSGLVGEPARIGARIGSRRGLGVRGLALIGSRRGFRLRGLAGPCQWT